MVAAIKTTGGTQSSGIFTTLTVNTPLPCAADVLLCFGGCFNATTGTFTFGPTSNSANFTSAINSTTATVRIGAWYAVQAPSPSTAVIAFTSGHTTSGSAFVYYDIGGVASTSPMDNTPTITNNAGSSLPQTPNIQVQTPNVIVFSVVAQLTTAGYSTAPTLTVPAGYSGPLFGNSTANGTQNLVLYSAFFAQAATQTYSPPQWASTSTQAWTGITVIVRSYVNPTSTVLPIDDIPANTQFTTLFAS
jgi:hypothetical protein